MPDTRHLRRYGLRQRRVLPARSLCDKAGNLLLVLNNKYAQETPPLVSRYPNPLRAQPEEHVRPMIRRLRQLGDRESRINPA